MICLIPARAGSKRVPGKNTRLLGGHPLIAYTIAVAQQSRIFDAVAVCTDDPQASRIARRMGALVIHRDPVADDQPDVVWVRAALSAYATQFVRPMAFCLLRPTSPFRTVAMLKRAKACFDRDCLSSDSLRAVEPVTQHPGKMWTWEGQGHPIKPLLPQTRADGTPWHSSPTQTLPVYYVQNASLEMAWTANVETHGTIAGRKVSPFFTEGTEGFDINTERDWREAEALLASGATVLPPLSVAGLSASAAPELAPDPGRAVAW